jgi:hypothetical protein
MGRLFLYCLSIFCISVFTGCSHKTTFELGMGAAQKLRTALKAEKSASLRWEVIPSGGVVCTLKSVNAVHAGSVPKDGQEIAP